jgi:hypothetical protein
MKRSEGVFSPKAQNGMYANLMHHKEIYYIDTHTDTQYLTHVRILHLPNVAFLNYTKV